MDAPVPIPDREPAPSLVVLSHGGDDLMAEVASVFRERGHDVLEARDGEALDEVLGRLRLLGLRPSLVVSDLRPRAQGESATAQ